MAILSKRTMADVSREFNARYGRRPYFTDLSGRALNAEDELVAVSTTRRKRSFALQESINRGEPCVFQPAPGISACMLALEDRRMIHGGLMGAEVFVDGAFDPEDTVEHLVAHGLGREAALQFTHRLDIWPRSQVQEAAQYLQELFYQVSGWNPELMKENRLKALQMEQITQAIEDQKKSGKEALYAFEKERALLVNIRAGDRNGARRILNGMLATIYMSSPRLVVLRARAVELISCLTRAAIEDNPLLEPLIERNHAWTERLVAAQSFEDLSRVLTEALDDFMEGIYLHGVNRSNTGVRKALDFIHGNFTRQMSLAEVARQADLSPGRMAHLIKEFTGRTFLQIVHERRIRHAQHLLQQTPKSCAEIAYEVGFGDQSYFIKHFKRLTGTTPARFRRSRPST
jgi:two-component system, response regulator YesN